MSETLEKPTESAPVRPPWYRSLFAQLAVAVVAGILVGERVEPLDDPDPMSDAATRPAVPESA
ncbi:hypothetical protein [Nocardia sp. IFM 10818]